MNSSSGNGRTTRSLGLVKPLVGPVKRKTVYAEPSSNHWSSTEYNSNNSWNVNFSDGNFNNNNKYNQFVVRPVVALQEDEMAGWIEAYLDCCQRKKSTIQCSAYRANYEADLVRLAKEVKSRTYTPSISTCFVVSRPKYREIFAANFRDRIVQHWIILRIEPLLEKRFREQGDVSFNCRKGFGTLAAVDRLRKNIEEISEGYTKEAWIGKFDMKNFFMSIDKKILLSLITKYLRENYQGDDLETLLWLIEVTITHCPQKFCIKRGRLFLWDELPPGKSLFNSPDGVGIPIGNITSQLLANFYLSFLDEYMNTLCGISGNSKYVRFVDDFVIVSRDKENITRFWNEANWYLWENLRITLHPDKKYIQEVKKGVKFVGSVIKPGRVYISNQTVGGFACMLNTLDIVCYRVYRELSLGYDCTFLLHDLEHYISSANSYLGFLTHTSSYAIRTRLINDTLGWFWKVCETNVKTKVIKIRPEYKLTTYYEKNWKNQTGTHNKRSKSKKLLVRKHRGNSGG